jgi:hypothetical protein
MAQLVQAFTPNEARTIHIALASRVASMLGRKFEEGDWSAVYCASKGIPETGWSNLSIDVAHGALGVEHKMICARSDQPIRNLCGTSIMHPAGTRSIRIPAIDDATTAARDILQQYCDLIDARKRFVECFDAFNNQLIDRDAAIQEILGIYPDLKLVTAKKIIPQEPTPTHELAVRREADMRTGWLIWQDSLAEFLYFEERTLSPNPLDYTAEWVESGGGRRKKSKNLWVYHSATGQKHFSITTEAGAKIQPYFVVPPPSDANLYYFRVQGEPVENGMIRIWLTDMTAGYLQHLLGSLETPIVEQAIREVANRSFVAEAPPSLHAFGAMPLLLHADIYRQLCTIFKGVSDEHRMQLLIKALENR